MISRSSSVTFEAMTHSVNESRRADPRNGVCLNSLNDKAFCRALVTFSGDLRVVISPSLRAQSPSQFHQWSDQDVTGIGWSSGITNREELSDYSDEQLTTLLEQLRDQLRSRNI